LIIKVIGDIEGLFPGPFRDVRRRNGYWELVGRKAEEGGGRGSDADGRRTKLGGHVDIEHDEPKTRKNQNQKKTKRVEFKEEKKCD
jgi:hypothetical protein